MIITIVIIGTIHSFLVYCEPNSFLSETSSSSTELDHPQQHSSASSLAWTIHSFLQNYHTEYSNSLPSFDHHSSSWQTRRSPHHSSRHTRQQYASCAAVKPSIDDCGGRISNNVSTLVANSLSFYKAQVTNAIDNFIEKVKSNYNGELPTGCESSARHYFCSNTFRHCLEDSNGHVEIEKPCQYMCTNLYLNCIKEKQVAEKSANHYCGTEERPSDAYARQPICTDVYLDRAMSGYLAMGLTLLGCSMLCGGVCSVSLCVCMVMNSAMERKARKSRREIITVNSNHHHHRDSIMSSDSALPFNMNHHLISGGGENNRNSLISTTSSQQEQVPLALGGNVMSNFGSVDVPIANHREEEIVVNAKRGETTVVGVNASQDDTSQPEESI